jgi:hypothetical protein
MYAELKKALKIDGERLRHFFGVKIISTLRTSPRRPTTSG